MDEQRIEAYTVDQFLLKTLQLVVDSKGDARQVCPVWTQQQAMLNEGLLAVIPQVVSQLFSQGAEQKVFIARVLVNFGNLIN